MKKLLLISLSLLVLLPNAHGQYTIQNLEGYTPQIGALVNMLDDLKARITEQVKDLDQEETDFLMDEDANRIGALIMHLAATEYYYQQTTFYDIELDPEKDEEWFPALGLTDQAREQLVDKPISHYLEKWDKIRDETKKLFTTKDDAWLLEIREPGDEYEYNYYFAWYHVMEHQANHMGQIALYQSRMDGR